MNTPRTNRHAENLDPYLTGEERASEMFKFATKLECELIEATKRANKAEEALKPPTFSW